MHTMGEITKKAKTSFTRVSKTWPNFVTSVAYPLGETRFSLMHLSFKLSFLTKQENLKPSGFAHSSTHTKSNSPSSPSG